MSARKSQNARRPAHPELARWRGEFVSVAGEVVSAVIEQSHDPRKIDHVWIEVRAGESGLVRISLNTRSLKNGDAGFDSRVRLGIVSSTWDQLPVFGIQSAPPLDYTAIEAAQPLVYVEMEKHELEMLLLEKTERAVAMEGWGEFYMQDVAGIHQLHSRRGSHGMPKDVIGRDGAVQFYFAESRLRELLLFKFAGQP